SFQELPHIAAFRAESQALVNMARSGVRLGHFELDLSIPALSGPVARPLDEEFPHPRPASLRRHPDVVNETLRLGRHEPTFAEDQIPEELVVRGLGDPPFRSVPRHVALSRRPDMAFPLAAVQHQAFVLAVCSPYSPHASR